MTSKGDAATKFFLPGGQWTSLPRNSLRTYPPGSQKYGVDKQRSYFVQSTANMAALQSHRLGRASDPDIQAACRAGL